MSLYPTIAVGETDSGRVTINEIIGAVNALGGDALEANVVDAPLEVRGQTALGSTVADETGFAVLVGEQNAANGPPPNWGGVALYKKRFGAQAATETRSGIWMIVEHTGSADDAAAQGIYVECYDYGDAEQIQALGGVAYGRSSHTHNLRGVFGKWGSKIAGTIDTAQCFRASVNCVASTVCGADGVGLYKGVVTSFGSGSSVPFFYGLDLECDPVSGAIPAKSSAIRIGTWRGTTEYAIEQTDASNICYFNGSVGIGVSAPKAKLHASGATIVGVAAAPAADGDLNAGEANIWVDQTTHELKVKVKYSNGTTVKTGTLAGLS